MTVFPFNSMYDTFCDRHVVVPLRILHTFYTRVHSNYSSLCTPQVTKRIATLLQWCCASLNAVVGIHNT